jgi:hypothetical protein
MEEKRWERSRPRTGPPGGPYRPVLRGKDVDPVPINDSDEVQRVTWGRSYYSHPRSGSTWKHRGRRTVAPPKLPIPRRSPRDLVLAVLALGGDQQLAVGGSENLRCKPTVVSAAYNDVFEHRQSEPSIAARGS